MKNRETGASYTNVIWYTGTKNIYQGNFIHNIEGPDEISKARIISHFHIRSRAIKTASFFQKLVMYFFSYLFKTYIVTKSLFKLMFMIHKIF